jgi:circadian clock protein KaiB
VNSTTLRFERLLIERDRERYVMRLYVVGMSPRSTDAIVAIKALCEQYLAGRYELEVVDIYAHPERAEAGQVIAAPTLLKQQPLPERRLVGNLSDKERVIRGLALAR